MQFDFNIEKDKEIEQGVIIPFYNKDVLLGKYNYKDSKDFIMVDESLSIKSGIYIRKEVYEKFKQMYSDAKKDGITLKIVSGTMNFYEQKAIWESKFQELRKGKKGKIDTLEICKKILSYFAMPGTSRHHWGTDIDINSTDNDYFKTEYGKNVYEWLKKNAKKYGFCSPYSDSVIGGYKEEKWHWSYAPLSRKFLENYIKMIGYDDIRGFLGCEKAKELRVIELFVKNIDKECE